MNRCLSLQVRYILISNFSLPLGSQTSGFLMRGLGVPAMCNALGFIPRMGRGSNKEQLRGAANCRAQGTYVRQRLDELVDVGLLGRPLDLILGHDPAVVSIGDVLGDAAVKQDGLLGHNA